jgi:threonine dehydrogenase-like Zn-dependent dehydrogenase
MFSVAVTNEGHLKLVDTAAPSPGPYQAKIRTEAGLICNATDRKLVEGHFPGVDKFPFLLGHETVGIVEEVGEKVRNFKVGDRVIGGLLLSPPDDTYHSGWGGFSEYILAGDHLAMVEDGVAKPEEGWVEVYEIMRSVPQSIAVEDAVMLCMWREVYGAFDDFHLRAGDDILIYGDGPIGLSFVKFARLLDLNDIYLVGKYQKKLDAALEMGANDVFSPDSDALQDLVNKRGNPFDAVIDAVGKVSIINDAIPKVKMGGSVCVYGVVDAESIPLQHHQGPYNFNLLLHQWPTRSRERAAQEPLIEWIQDGKLSYHEFLSGEFAIQDIAAAYEFSKAKDSIKTLLRF